MYFHEFINICCNYNLLIEFLIKHNVIKTPICPTCENAMRLGPTRRYFNCSHMVPTNQGQKLVKHRVVITKNSIFYNSNIPIYKFCLFFAYKLILNSKYLFLFDQLKLSKTTISRFNKIYSNTLGRYYDDGFNKIGGEGHIVEVDEVRLGPGENGAHGDKGFWVVGGYDRNTEEIFCTAVNNRNKETLCEIIIKFVKAGTTIYTDGWRAYRDIKNRGYHHQFVNHKYHFVDPEEGTHTQNIERVWGLLRQHIPSRGRRRENFDNYFVQYLINRHIPVGYRIEKFFTILGNQQI